ncbi:HET-domain-containing protein [Xylaria acuta]|nr:HET-domain-containing protein [Xylaria acuta]
MTSPVIRCTSTVHSPPGQAPKLESSQNTTPISYSKCFSDTHLLDATTYEPRSDLQPIFRYEGYAVLHRWVGREITFDQLKGETAGLRSGKAPARTLQVDKIRGAAATARNLGIKWIWIDSCCIDRANAVEKTESINSMFKWYRDAKVCITYLSDVQKHEPNVDAPGLECIDSELLAPQEMRFYDKDWKFIGTKMTLAPVLESTTGIDTRYLTTEKHFGAACIATKMSWMAGRTTMRVEDIVYSMLGIFNTNMTTRYGEGMRAFDRLQQTLLSTPRDESLFAWNMSERDAGAEFILFEVTRGGIVAPILVVGNEEWEFLIAFLGAVTLVGVCITNEILKYSVKKRGGKDFEYRLKCGVRNQAGELMLVRIYLRPVWTGYKRIRCFEFGRGDVGADSRLSKITEEAIIFQPATGYPD